MKSALFTANWQFQRPIQCVLHGLQVIVIVGIWKHIVNIKKKTVKQVVGKRMNKK